MFDFMLITVAVQCMLLVTAVVGVIFGILVWRKNKED